MDSPFLSWAVTGPPQLEALISLNNDITGLNSNEFVLVGDLNLDWLSSASDSLKSICDLLNLGQLIDSPSRPNVKYLY